VQAAQPKIGEHRVLRPSGRRGRRQGP
jgi:hypothetical protein